MDLTTLAIGYGVKLLGALIAFAVARSGLRILDKDMGFVFKDWFRKSSDTAKAQYLGFRILAICILFGMIL